MSIFQNTYPLFPPQVTLDRRHLWDILDSRTGFVVEISENDRFSLLRTLELPSKFVVDVPHVYHKLLIVVMRTLMLYKIMFVLLLIMFDGDSKIIFDGDSDIMEYV